MQSEKLYKTPKGIFFLFWGAGVGINSLLYYIAYLVMISFSLMNKTVPKGKREGAAKAAPSCKNKRADTICW